MAKFFLRIITDCCTQETELALTGYLHTLPEITEVHAEPIKPYWKHPKQGELVCSFVSAQAVEALRLFLADHWEDDVADARRSRIHVPHAVFLWLTF